MIARNHGNLVLASILNVLPGEQCVRGMQIQRACSGTRSAVRFFTGESALMFSFFSSDARGPYPESCRCFDDLGEG
jgi:hypothetical protein